MKKKLLSVLLAVTLMTGALVGCGEKEDNKEDKAVETVEEDGEEDKTTESNVVDLGNGMMMEYPGGEDDLIELEGEVTVIEDDEVQADSEWATAYADYFLREDIIPENVKMTMNADLEGIAMDIVVAVAGDSSYMRYAFDNAALDLYATTEKIYACVEMAGEKSWMYATITSEEEVDSIMSMTSDTTIVDAENVSACTYVEEIVEDGVVYDVLCLDVDDGSLTGEVIYYVNRETQKVSKFIMEQDGQLVECNVEEVNSIEIPAEAADATEGTMDDIAGALIGVMFSAMSMEME